MLCIYHWKLQEQGKVPLIAMYLLHMQDRTNFQAPQAHVFAKAVDSHCGVSCTLIEFYHLADSACEGLFKTTGQKLVGTGLPFLPYVDDIYDVRRWSA